MSDFSFIPPPEVTQGKRIRIQRPIAVVIAFVLLVLTSIMCSTAGLFAMLYHSQFIGAALVVMVGAFSAFLAYNFWLFRSWAWFATVFLLGIFAAFDLVNSFILGPMPSLPRAILGVLLLSALLPPKTRSRFSH